MSWTATQPLDTAPVRAPQQEDERRKLEAALAEELDLRVVQRYDAEDFTRPDLLAKITATNGPVQQAVRRVCLMFPYAELAPGDICVNIGRDQVSGDILLTVGLRGN